MEYQKRINAQLLGLQHRKDYIQENIPTNMIGGGSPLTAMGRIPSGNSTADLVLAGSVQQVGGCVWPLPVRRIRFCDLGQSPPARILLPGSNGIPSVFVLAQRFPSFVCRRHSVYSWRHRHPEKAECPKTCRNCDLGRLHLLSRGHLPRGYSVTARRLLDVVR